MTLLQLIFNIQVLSKSKYFAREAASYLLLVQCLEFYSLTIWLWLYSLYKSWSFVTKYKFYVQNFVNLLRKLFPKFW